MARGHQKFQSQQKNAKKQADIKKSKGHDQKAAAMAALVYTCSVCRTQMPDLKTFKQHFESKHPKSPMPPELGQHVYVCSSTSFFQIVFFKTFLTCENFL
uniref:Zinc finger protein 706 n=1 Tax=Labrus bergylta TaxID=56723 RepID=A0A3Q3GJM4_9LABR